MSGGEVAGLVLGGVALAELFTTCVEVFHLFELGKNFVYDYTLACTKVELLRQRIHTWGSNLRVNEPGQEDPILRSLWPTAGEVVGKSLRALTGILQSSEVLMQKYELRGQGSSNWSLNLRKRSIWAIHDSTKFNLLISDLAFFIENLEKVESQINNERSRLEYMRAAPYRAGNPLWKDRTALPDHLDDSPPEENSKWRQYEENRSKQYQGRGQQSPHFSTRHVISGTQYNSGMAIGIYGVVGSTGDTYWIGGTQINTGRALGVLGVISPEALAYLQDRAFARERRRT